MVNFLRKLPVSYIILTVSAVIVWLIAAENHAFEAIYQFSRVYEDWELDEFLTLLIVLGCFSLVILGLHASRLRREISRREEAESRAQTMARHDPLTGLPNRRVFNEKIEHFIESAKQHNSHFSVLVLDLDRFKSVNDCHGHQVGDILLQKAAKRLEESAPEGSVIARVGGDEFMLVIEDSATSEQAIRVSRRILSAIEQPFKINDVTVEISASIGVASFPRDADTAERIVHNADIAMYQAKKTGRNCLSIFNEEIGLESVRRMQVELDLRRGVTAGEFFPFFQPLIDMKSGKVSGFEVLARWQHATKGVIAPAIFIPIAEDIGLINEIAWQVLRKACQAAMSWDGEVLLSFNISPIQFRNPDMADRIITILDETGFPRHNLEIEITENAIIGNLEATRPIIRTLKNAGIQLALDDFGTGYSSLKSLQDLPFDRVKIDRSFIHPNGKSAENQKIVSAVIRLSQSLGLKTTAEGIEDEGMAEWLQNEGCDIGQGFLYSKPKSSADIKSEFYPGARPKKALVG